MNVRPLLAAVCAAAALTACAAEAPASDGVASAGGATASPGASAAATASLDPRSAQLKFAQCMREHGIEMDDPEPGGGIRIKSKKGDEAKMQEAQKACGHFMENAVGKLNGKMDPKARDQALKFAQCMREHGIDMKDPSTDGRIEISVRPGTPEEKVEAAHKACKEFEPGGGPR
ncbi:hypothetical protein [Nonomuraea roseoviolacea]|uniref:Uncharacterized protein n=1 Tax=Nonomuraea roseoviolacea subsp. carminata TaxID=160689 RepID=A0ABT1KDY1_9ACTN|nr:hypothetical protein [Nonomuraea roseoviolacea]MCP2352229.1 hypothetical protein [Nonomuraea roseoviolacea subsp. carminata]